MPLMNFRKAPSEVIDFAFDFRNYEALTLDPLTSGTVTEVVTTALTIGSVTVSGKKLIARISAGLDGNSYKLKVLGTTTGGQVFEENVGIDVIEP